jgi:hypothetical protein
MATLYLNSITCIDQQEVFGDELYVTFDGERIALPNMSQGDTAILTHDDDFVGSKGLSLFENDGNHWYDRDDFIDRHTIPDSPGDFRLDFVGGGAHYELDVSVVF